MTPSGTEWSADTADPRGGSAGGDLGGGGEWSRFSRYVMNIVLAAVSAPLPSAVSSARECILSPHYLPRVIG